MSLSDFSRIFVLIAIYVVQANGHGYLYDPPGRSTAWRLGFNTPINYDDNGLNCGGFSTQWQENNGLCGICGDSFSLPYPRDNELGGKYGKGLITRNYTVGSVIPVVVQITAPHKGYFKFSICNLDESNETEQCFEKLRLANGETKLQGIDEAKTYVADVQLPINFRCSHCVFRWHYRAGNNVYECRRRRYSRVCGPQETFRNCADIAIS